MVLKTIAKSAAKAVANPVKSARKVDNVISKVKKVAGKVNEAVMNKATKRYDKYIDKYGKAVQAEKNAKGPAEKYVTGKMADYAKKVVTKEGKKWTATSNTYDKINNKLKGKKK